MSDQNIKTSLEDFIRKTKESAEKGLGDDWELSEPIRMELSAVVKGKVGGGLDIQIVNFGTKVEAEQIQKVTLAISPIDEVKKAEGAAKIARAEAEKKTAERIKRQMR